MRARCQTGDTDVAPGGIGCRREVGLYTESGEDILAIHLSCGHEILVMEDGVPIMLRETEADWAGVWPTVSYMFVCKSCAECWSKTAYWISTESEAAEWISSDPLCSTLF